MPASLLRCCLCRFAGPRGGGAPHPPDSRRPARAEVLGAPAAAAGQGHEPERQLWGDAERDGGLSLDGAARPGRQPPSFTPVPVQTDQGSETRLLWKRSSGTENRELGVCTLELELLAQTLGHDSRSSTFVWWTAE